MIEHITTEEAPYPGTRAGLKLTDTFGDSVRLVDGWDGSALLEVTSLFGDVSLRLEDVTALRDYLNEVIDAAHPNKVG